MSVKQYETYLAETFIEWVSGIIQPGERYQFKSPDPDNALQLWQAYVELDGDVSQNLEAFEAVVRAMKEYGIGYGAINHPVDRDPVCGYNGIIGDVCPRCGRRDGEGVPLEKLHKLGLYKHLNAGTLGQCGNPDEEADRIPNPLA